MPMVMSRPVSTVRRVGVGMTGALLVAIGAIGFAHAAVAAEPAAGAATAQSRMGEPQTAQSTGADLRVFVRSFTFTGSQVFSSEQLREVVKSWEGRVLGTEDLLEVRQRLNVFFLQHGFVNSGVLIPDQEIENGVVEIRVVEGTLSGVEIRGTRGLDQDYVRSRILPEAGAVLNVNEMQERLQLLRQNPLIGRLQGELRPGSGLGESELDLLVEETAPLRVSVTIANDQSPSVGGEGAWLQVVDRNLSGRGDTLRIGAGATKGLDDGRISYALPVSARDASVSIGYAQSRSIVVEPPFDGIDIESRTQTVSAALDVPVHRTAGERFDLGVQLEREENRTFLLGVPFSFFAGADDGRSVVSPLRLSQQYVRHESDEALALRSTISIGLPAFGATVHDEGPDGRFVAWLAQLQWARRFGDAGDELALRAELQLSSRPLLPVERFPIGGISIIPDAAGAGGAGTVRGYRRNAIVRDNGVSASIDYTHPIWRWEEERGVLSASAFADYGAGWNKGVPTADPPYLASVGVGLRWSGGSLQAALYGALPLRNVERPHTDIQDLGVHFALVWSWDGDLRGARSLP